MAAQPCTSCQFQGYPEKFAEWRQILGAVVITLKLALIVFGIPALWSARSSSYVAIRQPALCLIFASGALFNLHIPLRELFGEGQIPCVVFLGGTYMFVPTFGFGLALRFLRIRVLHRMQNRVRSLMDVKKELPPLPGTTDDAGLDGMTGPGENGLSIGFFLGNMSVPSLTRTQASEALPSKEQVAADKELQTQQQDHTGIQVEGDGQDASLKAGNIDERAQRDLHISQPVHVKAANDAENGSPIRAIPLRINGSSIEYGVATEMTANRVPLAGARDAAGEAHGRPSQDDRRGREEPEQMLADGSSFRGGAARRHRRRRCRLPPLHTQRAQLKAIAIFIAFCLCQLTVRLLAFGDASDLSDLTRVRYGCTYNGFDYFWLLSFCVWFLFVLMAVLRTIWSKDDDFDLKSEVYIVIFVGTALISLFFLGKIDYRWHTDYITSEYAVTLLQIVYIIISVWLPTYRAYTDVKWSGELQRRPDDGSVAAEQDQSAFLSNLQLGLSRFSLRLGRSAPAAVPPPVSPVLSPRTQISVQSAVINDSGRLGDSVAAAEELVSRNSSQMRKSSTHSFAGLSPYPDRDRDRDGPVSQLSMPPMAMAAGEAPLTAQEQEAASQAGGSQFLNNSFENLRSPVADTHQLGVGSGGRGAHAPGARLKAWKSDLRQSNASMRGSDDHEGKSVNGSILFSDAWKEVSASQGQAAAISTLLAVGRAGRGVIGMSDRQLLRAHDSAESGSFYVQISSLDHTALQSLVLPDGGAPIPRPLRMVPATAVMGKATGTLTATDLQTAAYHLIYTASGRAHFAPLLQREFCLENMLFLLDALTYRRYVYGHLKSALQRRDGRAPTHTASNSQAQAVQFNASSSKTVGGASSSDPGGSLGALQDSGRRAGYGQGQGLLGRRGRDDVQLRSLSGKVVASTSDSLPGGTHVDSAVLRAGNSAEGRQPSVQELERSAVATAATGRTVLSLMLPGAALSVGEEESGRLHLHDAAHDAAGDGHAFDTQTQTQDFSLPGEVHHSASNAFSSSSSGPFPPLPLSQGRSAVGRAGGREGPLGAGGALVNRARSDRSDDGAGDAVVVSPTGSMEYAGRHSGGSLPVVEEGVGEAADGSESARSELHRDRGRDRDRGQAGDQVKEQGTGQGRPVHTKASPPPRAGDEALANSRFLRISSVGASPALGPMSALSPGAAGRVGAMPPLSPLTSAQSPSSAGEPVAKKMGRGRMVNEAPRPSPTAGRDRDRSSSLDPTAAFGTAPILGGTKESGGLLNRTKAYLLGTTAGDAAVKQGSDSRENTVQADSRSSVHPASAQEQGPSTHGQAREDRLLRLLPPRVRVSAMRYATRLMERYIDSRAEMCVNLPARMVARITHEITARRPTLTLFFEAEREILSLLVRGPVPRFVVSAGWSVWQEELKSQAAFQLMFETLHTGMPGLSSSPPAGPSALAGLPQAVTVGSGQKDGAAKGRNQGGLGLFSWAR